MLRNFFVFILLLCIFSLPTLAAGIYTISEDFNSGLPSIATLYGSASAINGYIQLTPIAIGQVGGMSFASLSGDCVVESWSAQFNFYAGGGTGADGFSLSFTRSGAVGAVGEWGTNSGIAVEFDTYSNSEVNDNHISLYYDGGLLATVASLPLNINSSQWHTARIVSNLGNVKVYLSPSGGSESLVLDYTVGTWTSYTGQFNFGARTGGSTDLHIVDNFNAMVTFIPEPTSVLILAIGLLFLMRVKKA